MNQAQSKNKKQGKKDELNNYSDIQRFKKQKKESMRNIEPVNNNPCTTTSSCTPPNEDDKIITRFKKKAPTCGICYEIIEKQGTLEICKHEFCFSCIQKWAKTENTCPLCKKRFSKIKNVWRRPFYGETLKKKLCTVVTKTVAEEVNTNEEVDIPYRNQSSHDNSLSTLNRLLNIPIPIMPILAEDFLDITNLTNIFNATTIERSYNELAEILFYTGLQNSLNQIVNISHNYTLFRNDNHIHNNPFEIINLMN